VKAHFIFHKYAHAYKVEIPNLEELSVEQIKEIQNFVSFRNGIFDFNNYSFKIQKTLEYEAFVSLIEKLGFDCKCEERKRVYKEIPRIGFGQYKGMYISDLPDSYLMWLKNNYHGEQKELFLKEISKRNST